MSECSEVVSRYDGPCLNCDQYLSGDYTDLLTQEEVIQAWYDWWTANGESTSGGPSQGSWYEYTEYREAEWNRPTGKLWVDQRHKFRGFVVWDAISTSCPNLSLSWLENFWSGCNYSLVADIEIDSDWVTNPGYEDPPTV